MPIKYSTGERNLVISMSEQTSNNQENNHELLLAHNRELAEALNTPDLTEDQYGHHCIGLLYQSLEAKVFDFGVGNTRIIRSSPIMPINQHFDSLLFAADAGVRSKLNTRYIDNEHLLRGQSAANIPPELERFAGSDESELMIISPGICFRSKKNDRLHASIVHQVDIWYLNKFQVMDEKSALELAEYLATQLGTAVLPDQALTSLPIDNIDKSHPYLSRANKLKIKDDYQFGSMTLMEYGVVNPHLLYKHGISQGTGVPMGIILERSVMLRKRVPDVRLIRSIDPKIEAQMKDLDAYKSPDPEFCYSRDISISIPEKSVGIVRELIENYIHTELGCDASVTTRSVTSYDELTLQIRERNGMSKDQVNMLISIIFKLSCSQSKIEINRMRDQILAEFDKRNSV